MDRKYNIIGDEAAMALAAEISAGFTEEALTAASNKGVYKRALKDADNAGDIHIGAGLGRVMVFLPDAEVSMCGDIAGCACSCPSKTVCRHIVTAAVILGSLAENISPAEESPAEEEIPAAEQAPVCDEKYLREVIKAVSGVLIKGIISCGENDIEVFSRLSLSAPAVHREIGKMCRSSAADMELMLGRKASFSAISAALRLCRIYNTAAVSMTPAGERLLFSGSDYESGGRGEFLCLGVYPHRSLSGFAGVTAVLFEKGAGRYFTYTSGMSDLYEKTENAGNIEALTKLTKAHSHWKNDVSLRMISGHSLVLSPYKADSSGKISSSKQTECVIMREADWGNIPRAAKIPAPAEDYDYFSPAKRPRFAAVEADRVEDISFDTAVQSLRYTVVSGGERIPCETYFTELSKNAVRYIKSLGGRELSHTCILVRFFGRTAQAVSLTDLCGVHNFYFTE